ncbi:hypothetical protein [Ralstonia pseudosolanacearum]|uniref:hypothetical protein n=1 Tax=Ralstonia pseudosolanacearum TaxID=1310165 RepID=UPI003CE7CC4B
MSDSNLNPEANRQEPNSNGTPVDDQSSTAVKTGGSSTSVERVSAGSPLGVSLTTTIIVAALLSAFSGVLSWHFAGGDRQQTQTIAQLDAAKLVDIQAKAALAKPGITTEEATKEGREFVVHLNQVLDEYTQAGVVVINASVALNRPAQTDITAQVAQKLGLKLD